MTNKQKIPWIVKVINPVAQYYIKCSQETQRNVKLLSSALLFTMFTCGSVLAISICTFCFNEQYWTLCFILPLSFWLYWQLELPIIFSDTNKYQLFIRALRIFIALVFSLFNSYLIDSFVFKEDISSARNLEIQEKENELQKEYGDKDLYVAQRKITLLNQIDNLNTSLMAKRDSLNAEADGKGGTHKPGTKQIWKSKYAMYQSDSVAVIELINIKQKELISLDATLTTNHTLRDRYINRLPDQVSNGLNKKMQLIHNVIFNGGYFTNIFMALLIFIVTTLFELIPIISKTFYNVSEYFQRANSDRTVIDKSEDIVQNEELKLASNKILYEFRNKEATIIGDYHINKLSNTIHYNRDILEQTENEINYLENAKAKYKEKHPEYYDSHINPIINQAYSNLHDASTVAISQ